MRLAPRLLGAALVLLTGCRAKHEALEQGAEMRFVATDPFGPAHYFDWELADDPLFSRTLWVAAGGRSAWMLAHDGGPRQSLRKLEDGHWSEGPESLAPHSMLLTPDGTRGWAFARDDVFEYVDGTFTRSELRPALHHYDLVSAGWISDDGRSAWVLVWNLEDPHRLWRYDDGHWRREPAADELLRAHPSRDSAWFRSDGAELWIPSESGLIHYDEGTWSYVDLGETINWATKLALARDGTRGWIGDRWQLADGRWTKSEHSVGATLDWLSDDGQTAWAHTDTHVSRLEHGVWTPSQDHEIHRVDAVWFSRDGTRGFVLDGEYIQALDAHGRWSSAQHFRCLDDEDLPRPRFVLDPAGRTGLLITHFGCAYQLNDGQWWWLSVPVGGPRTFQINATWFDTHDQTAWIVGIGATLAARRHEIPQTPPRMVRSSPTGSPFAGTYDITLAPGMVIDRALFAHDGKSVESPSDELEVRQLEPGHWTLELDVEDRVPKPNIHTHMKLFVAHEPSGFLQTWSTTLHRSDDAP